jgi:hypothetical protein
MRYSTGWKMKVGMALLEVDEFLIGNRSAHHIACCTWAGNVLRVAAETS